MEVKMSKEQKTKQGVAAIYVVVFTTMLIGIITLSFLRIMLSESGRTLNDTLSDSAYNSALAGVEDAKYIISQYEKKAASGESSGSNAFMSAIESGSDDCDIISKSMASLSGDPEPEGGEESFGTGDARTDQDQAYTCVKIRLSGDFKGTLSANNPTLVVPLRPSGKGVQQATFVDGIEITWTMESSTTGTGTAGYPLSELSGDFEGRSGGSGSVGGIVNNMKALKNDAEHKVLGQKGINHDDDIAAMNGMRVMLVQSPYGDTNPYYYASVGDSTNRGTLMLLSSTKTGVNEIGYHLPTGHKNPFVESADKTLNAPLSVKCEDTCSVKIKLPRPVGSYDRDPNNFFLVLNQLYSEPAIKVTVKMLDEKGENIDFFNVQPIIDSTGRSGDLFRRVEARVGTDNGASLLPTAELSSNSTIDKSFYVTKNCISGTTQCNH